METVGHFIKLWDILDLPHSRVRPEHLLQDPDPGDSTGDRVFGLIQKASIRGIQEGHGKRGGGGMFPYVQMSCYHEWNPPEDGILQRRGLGRRCGPFHGLWVVGKGRGGRHLEQ